MSALIHPKTITVDGLTVRYAEGGQDGPDAILMSPWPESAYTPSSRPGRTSRAPHTLSPQIYRSIFSGQKDVTIHTERKKLTIFFSDIQDFTGGVHTT